MFTRSAIASTEFLQGRRLRRPWNPEVSSYAVAASDAPAKMDTLFYRLIFATTGSESWRMRSISASTAALSP